MFEETPESLSAQLRKNIDIGRIKSALGFYRHLIGLNDYVKHRWHEPFQLADAAAAIGISPSRLSHLFREKTGTSFSDWMRYERVKRSTALLTSNDRSINEVAYSVGYKNPQTFQLSFKKLFDITPSQYRKIFESQITPKT